jgi:hypothetical protein
VAVATVLLAAVLVAPAVACADDFGINAKKLKIIDRGNAGEGKLVFTAKNDVGIAKGPDGYFLNIDAVVEVFYAEDELTGGTRLDIPVGTNWKTSTGSAKYVNKSAPTTGAVRKAQVKTGKTLKVVGSALGDIGGTPALDLVAGGAPSADGGIIVRVTVWNRLDQSLHRMCTRFATDAGSTVQFKESGGGTSRKLLAKDGVPTLCTPDYTTDTYWMCRTGLAVDECYTNDLDATEILPDTSTVLESNVGDPNQPYDCFYVYPTVNLGEPPGNHVDLTDITAEVQTTMSQFGRFNNSCRLFAPLYRQITFASYSNIDQPKYAQIAYMDVKAAWDEYMANYNGGRDIVLLGHSQGTFVLTQLMQEEFDNSPALQAQLITALLIGGSVTVPEGMTVGGSFANIPVCTSAAQVGCIIAYRTYAEGYGPEGGSNISDPVLDTACTNPAAEGGGEAYFEAYLFESATFPITPPFGFGTNFIKYDDFYAGECVKDVDNKSYLEIRVRPGVGDLRTNEINWDAVLLAPTLLGTHILDYVFPMGDLVTLVETKAAVMP